jgi:DNA-binding MarR family transcriptional regulator
MFVLSQQCSRIKAVTVSAEARRLVDDDLDTQASDLLLAFARFARSPRHDHPPQGLQSLMDSGAVARRHLATFTVVALLGPLTVSELAARQGLAVSTASLLVSQLSEAGMVERHEDADDRRRTVVSVAPAHRKESRAVIESKLGPMRRALERIGPVKAKVLLEAMGILAEEIARADEEEQADVVEPVRSKRRAAPRSSGPAGTA